MASISSQMGTLSLRPALASAMRSPFARLERLVRRYLTESEDEGTARLCRELRAARDRGYLTPRELEAVCRWKSPRAIWQVRANSHHRIRKATAAALRTRDEERRLEALVALRGVANPVASGAGRQGGGEGRA